MTYDVLVIGGGPAGLYAAYCLAIRDHATFNWHRAVILALWRSSKVRGFLWRSLAGRARHAVGAR